MEPIAESCLPCKSSFMAAYPTKAVLHVQLGSLIKGMDM